LCGDLGKTGDEAVGCGDQIGVVDDSERPLALLVGDERHGHLGPFGLDVVATGLREVGRFEQVVAQLAGEGGQLVDPAARHGEIDDAVSAFAKCFPQQLAGETRGDDCGRAELPEQAVGEPVVGGDLHFPALLGQFGQE